MKSKSLTSNLHSKSFFEQPVPETWKSWWSRWKINHYPAFRGTGGIVTYLHPETKEIHVKIPLNKKTRNINGTIFGGSMYGAVEWLPPIIIVALLGPEYIAWNKESRIQFIQPGTGTLYCRGSIDAQELIRIRTALVDQDRVDRFYKLNLVDENKQICAMITEVVQIRKV